MKIRGNKDDAETSFLTSYFFPNKLIAQLVALKVTKNPKISIRNLTSHSPSTIVVNFTTNN